MKPNDVAREVFGKLLTADERIAELLDPRNAPQPGGPWCELSVAERIDAMFAARCHVPDWLTSAEKSEWLKYL